MDFSIRPVRPDREADAVRALLHAAHAWNLAHGFNFTAADISAEELGPRLDPTRFWVAEGADGALLGTVEVKPDQDDDRDLRFHLLAVAPAMAGAGVGRALVAHAEDVARRAGARRLTLDTPEGHPWLPAFYRRLGYVPFGHVQWEGKRYRSVLMAKDLLAPPVAPVPFSEAFDALAADPANHGEELPCAACGGPIVVRRRDLAAGATATCPRCVTTQRLGG